jgi:hypothetical protein
MVPMVAEGEEFLLDVHRFLDPNRRQWERHPAILCTKDKAGQADLDGRRCVQEGLEKW